MTWPEAFTALGGFAMFAFVIWCFTKSAAMPYEPVEESTPTTWTTTTTETPKKEESTNG